jgi:hypothetical protein
MVDLSKIPVPEYQPNQPYHWEYDNLPIKNLVLRDELINNELENASQILRNGAGTQGNMANRIDQSIDSDGNLKPIAIDQALHSIAEHTDASKDVDGSELSYIQNTLGFNSITNPISFVRMLEAERSKLNLIADEATNIDFNVQSPSSIVSITEGSISFQPSDTITWDITAPATPSQPFVIKPNLSIGTTFAHTHYYDLEPITVDYQNYSVTSVNTPYIQGSLRVFVNGVRINSDYLIYCPSSNPTMSWTLNKFTPNHTGGTFALDNDLSSQDIIRIDFDISLT